jgi:hypothetical protein
MEVPAVGTHTYALPTGAGTVSVAAPANGKAQVAIVAGGLPPNSRARLRNDRGAEEAFTADGSGAATISIRADAGERLAITVDAISIPSDSSIVVWRPHIQFREDELAISFHYYKYLPNWCDAEGDGRIAVALYADATKPFHIGARVTDVNASLPWWVYATSWLGVELLGQGVLAPLVVSLIPTIAHALATSLLGGQDIASLTGPLTDQVSAPSLEAEKTAGQNVALLLDTVEVHETGLVLAGHADAGIFLGYDRTVAFSTQPGVVLSTTSPSVSMRFDWQTFITAMSVTSADRCAVITDQARERFWAASYDDLPDDAAFNRNPFPLDAGDAVMVWVETAGGHAKVLFERPPHGEAPSTGIAITWVAFRDRVRRSVRLVDGIKATPVGGSQGLVLDETLNRYDGTISLATRKFFLTEETRALGQEQWFWDDEQVTEAGIILPGGSVTLDADNRALIVHLDQSSLWLNGEDLAVAHWVKFHGTDVFGTVLETKMLVWTPPVVRTPRPIALNPPLGPAFVNPLGDPLRDRPAAVRGQLASELAGLLASRVGQAEVASLARSLSDALTTGVGQLDVIGAAGLLSLLSGGAGIGVRQH